jgi:hypothetical protein
MSHWHGAAEKMGSIDEKEIMKFQVDCYVTYRGGDIYRDVLK